MWEWNNARRIQATPSSTERDSRELGYGRVVGGGRPSVKEECSVERIVDMRWTGPRGRIAAGRFFPVTLELRSEAGLLVPSC